MCCGRGIHLARPGKCSSPAEHCRDVAKEEVGGKDYQRQGFVTVTYSAA